MQSRKGFSLVELVIVVLILGALAAIAIPRIMTGSKTARINACDTNVDIINMQIELYYADKGKYPTLEILWLDPNYFPDGEVVCPYDGTDYVIDSSKHRVTEHSHE